MHSRLAVLMAEKDPRLSQRELSRQTGLAPNTINKLHNDDFDRVDTNTIETLCAYFQCGLTDLFVLRDEPKE